MDGGEQHLRTRNDHLDLPLYSHSLSRAPVDILHVHRAGHNSARTAKPVGRLIEVGSGEEGEVEEERRSPGESL